MKSVKGVLLIGLLASLASTGVAADSESVKKDMAALQGEWVAVSASGDGQPMQEQMLKQMKRICKGDELTVMMGERTFFKAKITLDPTAKPKTIDYDMTEGFSKGKKQLGIYELEGDTLKSCFGAPGAERPTDFTSKAGEK